MHPAKNKILAAANLRPTSHNQQIKLEMPQKKSDQEKEGRNGNANSPGGKTNDNCKKALSISLPRNFA